MENFKDSSTIQKLITHQVENKFFELEDHRNRLKQQTDLALPLEEELTLLQQISEFELGQFLLANKGLNGYWTAYVHGFSGNGSHPLEKWILTRAPTLRAARERFDIFQKQLQKYLKSSASIASIPCGLMHDLLTLDYSQVQNVHLVGIDLDNQSLDLARKLANSKNCTNVSLLQKNAWDLDIKEQYDVITSSGLNLYVHNSESVVELYKEFYRALQNEGIFITSFMTPPPMFSEKSPWRQYDAFDLLKQKAIFSDIIDGSWQAFRLEEEISDELRSAGFKILDVIYDKSAIFPTIVAQK